MTDLEILNAIEQQYGVVSPDAVVSEAAREDHEWHDRFTWDDSEAAHQYRLEQARTVIRSVRLEIEYKTITIMPPAYVRDPKCAEDQQGYVGLLRLRRAKSQREKLLQREVGRAVGNLRRALHIALALNESGTASKIEAALVELDAWE